MGTNKKEIMQYHLRVQGIFGRNRKVKSESFLLVEVPAGTEIPVTELKSMADEKIAEIKVKSGCVKITRTPGAIETMGGIEFRMLRISLGVDNTVIDLGTI